MKTKSITRLIIAEALAVLFGLMTAGIFAYVSLGGAMLMSLVFFAPIMFAFLYGFQGLVPAITLGGVMFVGGYILGGLYWAVCSTFCGILPGVFMIMGSYKGISFFTQMKASIIWTILMYIFGLLLVYLLEGKDIVSVLVDPIRQSLDQLDAEQMNAVASIFRDMNLFAPETAGLQSDEKLLNTLISDMENALKLSLPTTVITLSFINSGVGVLWANYLRVRSGEDNVAFVPVAGWRLSKEVGIGVMVITLAVMILSNTMGDYAVSAVNVVMSAVILLMNVQTAASLLSRMKMLGMTTGKRTIFTVAIVLLSGKLCLFYGLASMMFGSQGIFRRKSNDKQQNNDNDEEE